MLNQSITKKYQEVETLSKQNQTIVIELENCNVYKNNDSFRAVFHNKGSILTFKTAIDLDDHFDNYNKITTLCNQPPQMTEFARYLGYRSSKCFTDIKKRSKGMFAESVARAREVIQEHHTRNITRADTKNSNGIFRWFVNEANWVDKHEHTGALGVEHRVIVLPEKKAIGAPAMLNPDKRHLNNPHKAKRLSKNRGTNSQIKQLKDIK